MLTLTQLCATPQSAPIAVYPEWARTDFLHTAHTLSCRLKAQNIQTCALWFNDAAVFACALLATWSAGATALLLPNLAQENLAWANTADILLTDVSDGIEHHHLFLWQDFLNEMPSEHIAFASLNIAPEACALLKTSGSSGEAKIIAKTAQQMQNEANALAQKIPFGHNGATVIASVSPQHMYGFTFRFALPLIMNWTLAREQAVYPENLLAQTMPSENVIWLASPAVLNRLGEERNWQAVQTKIIGIISAGGHLPEATADLLAAKTVRPFEIYGSTETGIIAFRQHQTLWQTFNHVELSIHEQGGLNVSSLWTNGIETCADAIEIQEGGFHLLGRQDRVIKLEDKRVSLVQIEHELLKHRWINDAHCAIHPHHKRLALWLALSSDGINALREQGRVAVIDALKRHLATSQDTIAIPRYWRFTTELPRNAQSKITANDFQTAFTQEITAPAWQPMPSESENTWQFSARVPLDLVYFSGHFARFPLVPGVIELQWIRDLIQTFAWSQQRLIRVENLKYQQFVRPNDELFVHLQFDADKNKLSFQITHQQANCASGRLVFDAV